MQSVAPASIERLADGKLQCCGDWTVTGITELSAQLHSFEAHDQATLGIDGSAILRLDSAGALLLQTLVTQRNQRDLKTNITALSNENQALYELVATHADVVFAPAKLPVKRPNFLQIIGEEAVEKAQHCHSFITFVGEMVMSSYRSVPKLHRFQWKSVFATMESSGYYALPIIGLLSFLIGIVLTYEIGLQLKTYGANVYIIELIGVAVLREFGPLITAVIVAGRTGSAFTAAIGTMKVNEEVDALQTLGVSPIHRLVLPRVLGLILVMPLLIVWSDAFGVLGGMVMTNNMMGFSYHAFLQRFQEDVGLNNYVLGLIKAPVFAAIIATVGCFQGFRVSASAESVGQQTTMSVVQAIFLIIVADALFSILFSLYNV